VQVHADQAGKVGRPPSWNHDIVTRVELLAGCAGHVALSGRILAATEPARVQVYVDGQEQELTTYGDTFNCIVPVKAGVNQVWLRASSANGSAQAGAPIIQVFRMTRCPQAGAAIACCGPAR
jgi:hypothetical protein